MQEYNEYLQEKIMFLEEEDELYKKCTKALNSYANAMRRKNSDFIAIASSMKKVKSCFKNEPIVINGDSLVVLLSLVKHQKWQLNEKLKKKLVWM